MRLFIGIALPDSAKEQFKAIQKQLPLREAVSRLVRPDQMHLTVKFLGETSIDLIPALKLALLEGSKSTGPFSISVDQLGTFPERGQVRIIWVGTKENFAALRKLQTLIDEALVPLGFARDEREFFPHITLARVKEDHSRKVREKVEALSVTPVAFNVGEVKIFQSVPHADGSKYEVLGEIKL